MAELSDKFEGEYQLFDYQDVSADDLVNHPRYALWYEVGTGKTLTAVAALNRLPEGSVLILAPKRVIDGVWCKLDVPIKHKKITFLNYEKLSRMDKPVYADYVVLDESQKVKSGDSKVAKKVRMISKRAKYVWCLSGTPVGNSYIDVFNIFKNIGINEFQYPETAFIARYYVTAPFYVQTRYGTKQLQKPIAVRNAFKQELFDIFSKYSNSLKMEDVHTLPTRHEVPFFLDGMVSKEYVLAEQGIIAVSKDDVSVVAKLEAVGKCHQLANGFMYYKADDGKNHIKRLDIPNVKLEKLKQIMKANPNENFVVVYKFKADKMLIERELTKMGYHCCDDFNDLDDPYYNVFMMQIGSGEGINPQKWSHIMILYSFDYSHLAYTQTTGRLYRLGQTKETYYYILIAKGTVEEVIYSAIQNKHSLDTYLKEVTKLVL